MLRLAIIPARGGSKRIPRKNIKDFLGKPIIAYSIEVALQSRLFDEVMVSTEDDEIAKIAEAYGAKVPFRRSQSNADDYATTADVVKEVINSYNSELGRQFESICCIYPTAPLLTIERLQKGCETLENQSFDSVIPVTPFSFPPQRAVIIQEDSSTKMIQPESKNKRSQDLEEWYHDAGQFYWLNNQAFLNHGELWTNNTGSIIIAPEFVQDIDNPADWIIAEMKYKLNG